MLTRVLVIDDHPSDRRLLEGLLEREGFVALSAKSGEEGLEVATRERPDLVLLDVGLPGKNGYEVCLDLRAQLETSAIPVIFLSAHDDDEHKVQGLELGAVDYITKPFELREAIARIRTQLRISHLNRSAQELNDELMRLSQDLMEKQRALEEDLKAAAEIQSALLPREDLSVPGLELVWRFVPSGKVGGDLLGYYPLDEARVALTVFDVTGHGVPAAMVTCSVAQSLAVQLGPAARWRGGEPPEPREVMERLDQEFPLERFDRPFSICYVELNAATGAVRYASAAHPAPIVVRKGGRVEELEEGSSLIGLGEFLPYENGEAQLEAGDRLFLYTDGVTEVLGAAGELFGVARLRRALVGRAGQSLATSLDDAINAALAYGGGVPPRDDISVLGAGRMEGGG